MILVLRKETNGSKSYITFLQRKELMSLTFTHLQANCETHQNHNIFQYINMYLPIKIVYHFFKNLQIK